MSGPWINTEGDIGDESLFCGRVSLLAPFIDFYQKTIKNNCLYSVRQAYSFFPTSNLAPHWYGNPLIRPVPQTSSNLKIRLNKLK